MSTAGGVTDLAAGWWRWLRVSASAAGLLLIERQLLVVMGTPAAQVRMLRGLGLSPADPVTPLLAVLALLSETLIGYVVVVLALRALSLLPGSIGSLTGRAALLLSPTAVRCALDLLVGGTLLAQATLTVMPGAPAGRPAGPVHSMTACSESSGRSVGSIGCVGSVGSVGSVRSIGSVTSVGSIGPTGPATSMRPETRPPSRRLAAPLPPWLGGGPSNPQTGYTVEPSTPGAADTVEPSTPGTADTVKPGDTLWDIAARHLRPTQRSPANVQRYWRQIYRANRPAIGADPDLIHPGIRLDVPRFRSDRR